MKRIAAFALCCTLAACASDEHTKEIEHFNDANYFQARGRHDSAQRTYQKLLDEAPDSPFRIHALLGSADSYYLSKEFIAAAPAYGRFVELYPQDPLTPQALFYQGMSYYMDIVAIKKDQSSAEKALEVFERFAKEYPTHPAAPFAAEKVTELADRLAEKDFLVVKYYFDTAGYVSCIGRVDAMAAKWPNSRLKPDALLLKGRSYLAEEAFAKGKAVFQQLAADHPNTDAGREAAEELKKLQ